MSQAECEPLIGEFRVHRFVVADHHAGRILYLIYIFVYTSLYLICEKSIPCCISLIR
jgi:hypothetical protein